MGVKRKLWFKTLAVFMATLIVMQILPMTVFANEKANIEALDTTIAETEPANIEYELEEERDEFSKTYLLEDGTYASIISAEPIHTENGDGTWNEIAEISESETVSEIQSSIQSATASTDSGISDNLTSTTTDYTGITAQSIGTYISGLEDDELRIQDYSINDTDKAYSLAYIKLNDLKLPDLGDKCIITKATLNAYCSKLSGSQNNIVTAKIINDAWPNNNTNEHPVGNKVLDYNAVDSSSENLYEWDITEAACLWSNKTIDNNGIALFPQETNCKISAFVDSIVVYYKVVDELDNDFSFHSVDMGRAGTAYINDYTNDFYLVRNEVSIDGNVMPVSVTRTYNNSNNTNFTSAGSGWHWNYVSTLTKVRKLNMYKWVLDDNSEIYFEATNDPNIWNEQGKTDSDGHCDGYILNIGDSTNTITAENDYTYIFNPSSHKLTAIKDEHNKTITLGYTDDLGLTTVTDGLGRSFKFGSTIFNSNKYVNKISVVDSNGSAIKLDGSDVYLQYSYSAQNQLGNRTLAAVLYRDSKRVDYTYDENGNMTAIKNIDGTSLSISYDENAKVTSYTKYASDEKTVLESYTINAAEAYQRIFTDNKGNVTRQQYDSSLNVVSEITGEDGYFSEYDENNELKSLSVTEEHTNLLVNGNFENGNTGWKLSNNASVIEDENRGYKPESYGNHTLKITGNYQSNGYAIQKYQFADAQENHKDELYTLGAWVKVNGSKAKDNRTVGILVNEYFNDEFEGETIGENIATITYDNSISEWQYMMVTFQLKNDAEGFQIALSYNNQLGDVEFDGVTLYKSTQSSVIRDKPIPTTCPCKNCSEPDCPCDCEDEKACTHIWCKRGTTTVENEYGLTTKETTTDAVSKMESTHAYNDSSYYLTESVDENGNTVFYEYDPNTGKLTSMAAGSKEDKINYTYNAVGLLKTVSQTVTNIVTDENVNMLSEYTYDGDTLKQISHNDMTYSYDYDVYGNPTSIKVNNTALAEYTYTDDGSNIGSIIYANGGALVYTYDDSGNILTISTATVSDTGSLENQTLKYQYTYNDGELASITDNTNNTITRYEDNGYKTYLLGENSTETQIYSYTTTEKSSNLSYVNNGITIGISNISSDEDYNRNTGKTVYSGTSQISRSNTVDENSITKTANTSAEVDYYNRTLSSSFGSGDNTLTNNYSYKTITNENGNTTTSNQVDSTSLMLGTEEYSYSYTYDNAGRLTSKSLNNELLVSYAYDAAGQLVRENNKEIGETYLYTYDKGGNKLAYYYCEYTEKDNISIDDCTVYDECKYENEWSDQVSNYNNTDITYDKLGNMIKIGDLTKYYWEGRQLTKSRVASALFNHYSYNENGLLTEKKSANFSGSNLYADYKYVWNENSQLAYQNLYVKKALNFIDDYGHSTKVPIGNYTTFIIYNELDEAVGFSIDDGTDIKVYYYIKDVTGQINAVADVETNTIVYSCIYDAWGCILDEYCTDALVAYGNPLRYKDYNYDVDSCLYYLQSRYYDATMGRFINADDPMLTHTENAATISANMYLYCENDPINYFDYNGMARLQSYPRPIGLIGDGLNRILAKYLNDNYKGNINIFKSGFTVSGTKYAQIIIEANGKVIKTLIRDSGTVVAIISLFVESYVVTAIGLFFTFLPYYTDNFPDNTKYRMILLLQKKKVFWRYKYRLYSVLIRKA